MMGFAETAFGIDVGDGTLKVVKLTGRGRRVKLERTWRLPYYLSPGNIADAALDALEQIRPHIDNAARVVIAAPSATSRVQTYTVPALESDRSEELARYEILRDVNRPAEELLVRHRIRKGAVEQQVHTFALVEQHVERWTSALRARSIPYDDVQVASAALASFLEFEQPRGKDRVILAVGAIASELVLMTEGGLWTRHLPFGLADEEDLSVLAQRLSGEIGAAVTHLLPTDRAFEPSDIVLTEEGALQSGLITALESVTGRDVTRVSELSRFNAPRRLDWDGTSPQETLAMGKAFGLALAGLELGRFWTPVFESNPQRESARRLPLATAAVFLSAMGIFAVTEQSRRHVTTINNTLPAQLSGNYQDLSNSWGQIVAERDLASAEADALLDIGERRTETFELRRALDIMTPLLSMRAGSQLHVEKVWLSTSRPTLPGTLVITVHAHPRFDDTLPENIQRAYAPAFEDVRVRGPEPASVEGLSRFLIEIALP